MANDDQFYNLTHLPHNPAQPAKLYDLDPTLPTQEEVNAIRKLVKWTPESGMPYRIG